MPAAKKSRPKKTAPQPAAPEIPLHAPQSPVQFRARVRMYRHGLGDCFLLSFPRPGDRPFHILIDFGALARTSADMQRVAAHIRDSVRDASGRAKLDVVVATHEHQDHLSGFNQARDIFDNDIDIGAVWMAWTEKLTQDDIRKIKETRRKAVRALRESLSSPRLMAAATERGKATVQGMAALLEFHGDDDTADTTGRRSIAQALEYLKKRGQAAGDIQFLEPGSAPLSLTGVPDARVFVLGPPRDPLMLKRSQVTESMKHEGVIYHLASTGEVGIDALAAAAVVGQAAIDEDRYHPFSAEHRITPGSPYYAEIKDFVDQYYNNPAEEWRRIEEDWLGAFGQLAIDLDNDTNNSSLVLAFEFEKTGEVLLFVADAQVGNWQSWEKVEFQIPGRSKPLPARDLVSRTVFYKVGHHCSHNATLKTGGLEQMASDSLIAFIPLDEQTAKSKKTKYTPEGWDMPARPLFTALNEKAANRVVISDRPLPSTDFQGRVFSTDLFVDYFLI